MIILGIIIPQSGGSETLTDDDAITTTRRLAKAARGIATAASPTNVSAGISG